MLKIDELNTCECLQKLMILGFLKEYSEDDKKDCYYDEIEEGQICMKRDVAVDNGNYNEEGIYDTLFEVTSTYYPISNCPLCGKKIEYRKEQEKSLKLV